MNTSSVDATDSIERTALRASWHAATDVGKKRTANEDSHLATAGMWIIADGMGGHSAGKVASDTAIQVLAERADDIPLDLGEVPQLLEAANRRVRDIGREEGYEVIGTTLSGILLVDNGGEDALLLFNVGDSRCYELVEERVVQRTVDHSYVQELIDRGEIEADEARTHPDRNVVSRALGLEETVSADFWVLPRQSEARFLLCSDGLTNELEEDFIAAMLYDAATPDGASDSLMASVATTPARDNTTLIVLDCSWANEEQGEDEDDGALEITVEPARKQQPASGPENRPAPELIDAVPGRVTEPDAKSEPNEQVVDGIPADLGSGEGAES